MTEDERIIAVALLTQTELSSLGQSFDRAWPVEETGCFAELISAIDRADRQLRHDRDEAAPARPLRMPPIRMG